MDNPSNQVINQLSNRPSNASELELFKKVFNQDDRRQNVKKSNGRTSSDESIEKESNKNETVKKITINGQQTVPLHKLMKKDELKLFFNDLYNEEMNDQLNPTFKYHLITDQNATADQINESTDFYTKSTDEGKVSVFNR